jgi:integrase
MVQLHRSHVKRLLAEKHEQGCRRATIRLIRATISAIYAAPIDDGVAIVNPAILPRRAKALGRSPRIDIRPLSELELAAFLNAAEKEYPARCPFSLLLARAGLRPGEARALKWTDVDFGNRKLTVAHSLSEDDDIEETKTGATKHVDLSQALAQTLGWLRAERELRAVKPRLDVQEDWFLSTSGAGLFDDSRVRKAISAAGQAHRNHRSPRL